MNFERFVPRFFYVLAFLIFVFSISLFVNSNFYAAISHADVCSTENNKACKDDNLNKTLMSRATELEITIPTDQRDKIIDSCRDEFLYHPLSEIMFDGLHLNDEERTEYRENFKKYINIEPNTIIAVPELSSSVVDTWHVILRAELNNYEFYIQCMQSMYKKDGHIKNIAFVALDSFYFVKYGMQFFKRFARNLVDRLVELQTPKSFELQPESP